VFATSYKGFYSAAVSSRFLRWKARRRGLGVEDLGAERDRMGRGSDEVRREEIVARRWAAVLKAQTSTSLYRERTKREGQKKSRKRTVAVLPGLLISERN
jgi:hypothetical protein